MTREKHLDHMVRVVPFIVGCYAVQCYVIFQMSPSEFSTISLTVLGGFLALMIASFITYDLKHLVQFHEAEVSIRFLGSHKTISYEDIWAIEVIDPDQNFSTLILKCQNRSFHFYFVDDAQKIKQWIEEKKQQELKAAA